MSTLENLKEVIVNRQSISFEYIKENKIRGKRTGNPHAVFPLKSKNGERSIKVHIFQTDGVSDSKDENPLPEFRMFDLDYISGVSLIEGVASFTPSDKYNPSWEGYAEAIVKI